MSRAVRLELPFPPKELSPNARDGWRKKARLVRWYREQCGWEGKVQAKFQSFPRFVVEPPVEASVTFVVPDRRKRDEDNLLAMLKPAWDGLVDAGVLSGDDSQRFSVKSVEIAIDKGRSYVLVVLRGAE